MIKKIATIMYMLFFALSFNLMNSKEFICNNEASCSNNGFCFNKTKCVCLDKYGTKENELNVECNYIKRSKKTAFLISFFLGPIGIDQIYMGNALQGSMKIFISLLFILFGMGLYYLGKLKENHKLVISGKVLEIIGTIFIILWWLIDWVLILCNVTKDVHGQLLDSDL